MHTPDPTRYGLMAMVNDQVTGRTHHVPILDQHGLLPLDLFPDLPSSIAGGMVGTTLVDEGEGNVVPDVDAGDLFTLVLDAAYSMNEPLNPVANKRIMFRLVQANGGSNTVSWNAIFRWSVTVPRPTLSTIDGTTDYVIFVYNAVSGTWDAMGVNLGFAP